MAIANTIECRLLANPDVSGATFRLTIYTIAFLSTVATELTQSIELGKLLALLTTSTSTAVFLNALFKSSQERLSLYDAVVSLFLIYIVQLSSVTSLLYNVSVSMFILINWVVISISLGCASFFLKVFLQMSRFGPQPDCNVVTFVVILWRSFPVMAQWLRTFLVGIFGIFVILLSMVWGAWFVFTIWVCCGGSASPIFEGYTRPDRPPLTETTPMARRVARIVKALCAQGVLIWWLELTVRRNVIRFDPDGSAVGNYMANLIFFAQIVAIGLYCYRRIKRDEGFTV